MGTVFAVVSRKVWSIVQLQQPRRRIVPRHATFDRHALDQDGMASFAIRTAVYAGEAYWCGQQIVAVVTRNENGGRSKASSPQFTDFLKRRDLASETYTWLLRETAPGRNGTHNLNGVVVDEVGCYNQNWPCPERKRVELSIAEVISIYFFGPSTNIRVVSRR